MVAHPNIPMKKHCKHFGPCYNIWRLLTWPSVNHSDEFWGSTSITKLTQPYSEKALTILLLWSLTILNWFYTLIWKELIPYYLEELLSLKCYFALLKASNCSLRIFFSYITVTLDLWTVRGCLNPRNKGVGSKHILTMDIPCSATIGLSLIYNSMLSYDCRSWNVTFIPVEHVILNV